MAMSQILRKFLIIIVSILKSFPKILELIEGEVLGTGSIQN